MSPIAHTSSTLSWRIDGTMVDMPAGTELHVEPMNQHDTKDWQNRIGCVAVEWSGKRRFVPAADLTPKDAEADRILKAAKRQRWEHEQTKKKEEGRT